MCFDSGCGMVYIRGVVGFQFVQSLLKSFEFLSAISSKRIAHKPHVKFLKYRFFFGIRGHPIDMTDHWIHLEVFIPISFGYGPATRI